MSFDQILEFVRSQNEFIIYAILLASAFIENIAPPFPGDAVMLSGAFLAGQGNITYIGVLLSVTVGGILGAMVLYYLGQWKGRKFFETGWGHRLIKGNLARVDNLFRKYGSGIILVSRFLAGIRSAIAVSAGIAGFPTGRMWIFTSLSFLLWYSALTGLMIYSKSNWQAIVDLIKHYNIVLLILGFLILAGWIIRSLWIKNTK